MVIKKKILSIFTSIACTASIFTGVNLTADAAVPFKGSGTTDDPYQISTSADLVKLSELINDVKTNETYTKLNYIQTADIDMSGVDFTPIGKFWDESEEAISLDLMFYGIYDGNYHKITNLNVDISTPYAGLFGHVHETGEVNYLSVSGNVKTSGHSAGGIAGELANGATILGCSFVGDVSAVDLVGGITGNVYNGAFISKSYANADLKVTKSYESSDYIAGGITGGIDTGSNQWSTDTYVLRNYFVGTITGSKLSGGICGSAKVDTTYTHDILFESNCYLNTTAVGGVAGKSKEGCTAVIKEYFENSFNFAFTDDSGSPFNDWLVPNSRVSGQGYEINGNYPVFGWEITPYKFEGSGTKSDPYLIGSSDELKAMRDLVNNFYYSHADDSYRYPGDYAKAYYKQTADIDLENELWTPIGISRSEKYYGAFTGVYDGNQKSVYNLNVEDLYDKYGYGYHGLFGFVYGASSQITELAVYGTVKSNSELQQNRCGGIAGRLQQGKITGCCFIGDVTADNNGICGGIVGALHYGTINSCYHNGNVGIEDETTDAGGIAGIADGAVDAEAQIFGCYHANGKIAGQAINAIAFVSANFSDYVTIKSCYAEEGSVPSMSADIKLSAEEMKTVIPEKLVYAANRDETLNDGYPVFEWQLPLYGDIDDDGEITVSDVVLLQKYLVKAQTLTEDEFKRADECTPYNNVDVFDLVSVKRIVLS